MAGRLGEFVENMRRADFVWGRFDCILNLADWSFEIGQGDPAGAFRGRYGTPMGASRIIKKAGGLIALVKREFERVGWAPVPHQQAGDIGVVVMIAEKGPAEVGAICLGDRWAVLGMSGVIVGQFEPTAIWRSSCLKL